MKDSCCDFFKAVSDPTRVKIMLILSKKEMCVSDICKYFEMTQPSISHHLNILKKAGIVRGRKEGKEVYYSLDACCIAVCCGDFMARFKEPEEKK